MTRVVDAVAGVAWCTPGYIAGLAVALALGVAAGAVGDVWPVVGAPVIAVVAGAVLGPLVRRRSRVFAPGLGIAKGFVLQVAVVLLGAQLSLGEVATVGVSSLPVMLGTLVICLGAAWLIGRPLGVQPDLRTLIGVGTAICGASAIAAIGPTIKAKSVDIAYAVSTIFLFNVAGGCPGSRGS